ncbi:MAG TPA: hypothetical protein VFO62_09770, partial [Candidatus Binatia bacterium]|nr:hypothetical protein [Candidatus Binatia bacterium]
MPFPPTNNLDCYGGRDGDWHRAVLASCPSLRDGFAPSFWARSAHVQNALAVLRGDGMRALRWDREERQTMADGGTVSIQWVGLDAPADTPVIVLLHTITGSGDGLRRFVS